jgi:hypothetical protein
VRIITRTWVKSFYITKQFFISFLKYKNLKGIINFFTPAAPSLPSYAEFNNSVWEMYIYNLGAVFGIIYILELDITVY